MRYHVIATFEETNVNVVLCATDILAVAEHVAQRYASPVTGFDYVEIRSTQDSLWTRKYVPVRPV